jgi:hypothetical protein
MASDSMYGSLGREATEGLLSVGEEVKEMCEEVEEIEEVEEMGDEVEEVVVVVVERVGFRNPYIEGEGGGLNLT